MTTTHITSITNAALTAEELALIDRRVGRCYFDARIEGDTLIASDVHLYDLADEIARERETQAYEAAMQAACRAEQSDAAWQGARMPHFERISRTWSAFDRG